MKVSKESGAKVDREGEGLKNKAKRLRPQVTALK